MGCNKIIVIVIILFILFFITMKIDYEKFQTPTRQLITNIKTDLMNVKVNLDESTINLDPHSTDKNINIGNSIIVKGSFNIDGYDIPIDIPYLRYIKHLPIKFEKELCLTDTKGTNEFSNWMGEDCINKKHLELIKGERKFNLETYPQNYKRCLGTKNYVFKSNLSLAPSNQLVFSSNKCGDGKLENEFIIGREPHAHEVSEIHHHKHLMEDREHKNDVLSIVHD